MTRLTRASLMVGLILAACGPSIDERYEPDVERLCNGFCELLAQCGSLEPWYPDHDGCFTNCSESAYWENDCNREYETRVDCQVELTCQELHDQSVDSELPEEQQPCNDEKWDHALCLDEKVD